MRCIKCLFKNLTIRRLFLVFVPVLSFFGLLLSSSSVSALSGSFSFDSIKYQLSGTSNRLDAYYDSNGKLFELDTTNTNSSVNRVQFISNYHPNLSKGQKYYLTFTVFYPNGSPSIPNFTNFVGNADPSWPGVGVFSVNDIQSSFSSSVTPSWNNSSQQYVGVTSYNYISYVFKGEVIADQSPWQGYFLFGGPLLTSSTARAFYLSTPVITFYDQSDPTTAAIEEQTAQDKEFHDEAQNTFNDSQDNANTDADSSSQQAEQSGSTLLEAVTQFIGALTGSSASNCVINANIGQFEMGNVDLCQLSPPPAFQVIGSLMVIGFAVPLSIALAKKMISLFRSFQG